MPDVDVVARAIYASINSGSISWEEAGGALEHSNTRDYYYRVARAVIEAQGNPVVSWIKQIETARACVSRSNPAYSMLNDTLGRLECQTSRDADLPEGNSATNPDVVSRAQLNADAPYDTDTCRRYPWAAAARIRFLEQKLGEVHMTVSDVTWSLPTEKG